jgi:hypothetical protein
MYLPTGLTRCMTHFSKPNVAPGDKDIDDNNNDEVEEDDKVLLDVEDKNGGKSIIREDGGGNEGGMSGRKRRKRNGDCQHLTRDCVEQLDGISFQWVVPNPNTKSWEERFEDLKEYQQMHGSTPVPQSSGALGKWMHMQVSSKNSICSLMMCVHSFL